MNDHGARHLSPIIKGYGYYVLVILCLSPFSSLVAVYYRFLSARKPLRTYQYILSWTAIISACAWMFFYHHAYGMSGLAAYAVFVLVAGLGYGTILLDKNFKKKIIEVLKVLDLSLYLEIALFFSPASLGGMAYIKGKNNSFDKIQGVVILSLIVSLFWLLVAWLTGTMFWFIIFTFLAVGIGGNLGAWRKRKRAISS